MPHHRLLVVRVKFTITVTNEQNVFHLVVFTIVGVGIGQVFGGQQQGIAVQVVRFPRQAAIVRHHHRAVFRQGIHLGGAMADILQAQGLGLILTQIIKVKSSTSLIGQLRHPLPLKGVAVLLMHIDGERVCHVLAAVTGIDTQLAWFREVKRVGRGIGNQRVVFFQILKVRHTAVVSREGVGHLAHIRIHGQ